MKLIHIAKINNKLLYLNEIGPDRYGWYDKDTSLGIESATISEAFRLAKKAFPLESFQPLACGYKFTLPERDEHGKEALYIDMARSLDSSNGIYFDEKYGHNFIVNQIPLQAREIYYSLKKS